MGGFRQFANEINSKGAQGAIMPTYDNFKKDNKFSPQKSRSKKPMRDEAEITGTKADKAKEASAAWASEQKHWEKYNTDLILKVKNQREQIKKMDEKQERHRAKCFEAELEMRILHKVNQKKMIEFQKSKINNVLPKSDRLYMRLLDRERHEIEKQHRIHDIMHRKNRKYGIKYDEQYLGFKNPAFNDKIEIAYSDESGSEFADQTMNRENAGSSRRSRRSELSESVTSEKRSTLPHIKQGRGMEVIKEEAKMNRGKNNDLEDSTYNYETNMPKGNIRDQEIISGLTVREWLNNFLEKKEGTEKMCRRAFGGVLKWEMKKKQDQTEKDDGEAKNSDDEKEERTIAKDFQFDPNYQSAFLSRTQFIELLQEEKIKTKPKKSTPMEIKIQQEFLRDQGKTKKAEQAWFNRLEEELDRIEMDEALLQYKIDNSKKAINKELMDKKKNSTLSAKIPNEDDEDNKNRPSIQDTILKENDQDQTEVKGSKSEMNDPENPEQTEDEKQQLDVFDQKKASSLASSSNLVIDYKIDTIRNCIGRISQLNQKQMDRAFKETARNRKVNSIGSFQNMTIGQAYFNLNKTTQFDNSSGGYKNSMISTQRFTDAKPSPINKRKSFFAATSAY